VDFLIEKWGWMADGIGGRGDSAECSEVCDGGIGVCGTVARGGAPKNILKLPVKNIVQFDGIELDSFNCQVIDFYSKLLEFFAI
jgi:hypothetical protein